MPYTNGNLLQSNVGWTGVNLLCPLQTIPKSCKWAIFNFFFLENAFASSPQYVLFDAATHYVINIY